MSWKEIVLWLVVIIALTPFIGYGAADFIPGYDSFIVTSGSMEPEIQTGALLYTVKTDPASLKVGETITFSDESHYTTHEIIEKRNTDGGYSFRTKGVANEKADPGWTSGREVVGKELFSIPYLGYLITWAGTFWGTIALMVIPGTVILVAELRSIFSEVDRNKDSWKPESSTTAIAVAFLVFLVTSIMAWTVLTNSKGVDIDYTQVGILFLVLLGATVLLMELV